MPRVPTLARTFAGSLPVALFGAFLGALVACALCTAPARAQNLGEAQRADAERPPPEASTPPGPPGGSSSSNSPAPTRPERRALPNYDGRDDAPEPIWRHLLALPRALFSPLYILAEYGLRRPFGALARRVETEGAASPLDIFTFGSRGQLVLLPTVLIEFGRKPSVGAYLRWDEAGTERNFVRTHVGFWGPHWLALTAYDRYKGADDAWEVEARVEATRRPDGLFYGLGGESRDSPSAYGYRLLDLSFSFEARPFRASVLSAYARYRRARFRGHVCCAPPLREQVASGVWESLPDGYEGYEALTYGTELTLDSRQERPHNVSGVHARALVEHGVGVGSARGDQWVRAGGSLGFFADLSGAHHTLSLTTSVGRTVPLRGQTPFFELTDIGGSNAMRGFRTFRLMGESYATAILQYSWPLWIYLDGLAQVAVGNTFSGRFEGFRPGNLRMSFGVGLSAVRSLEHRFDFSVGWGTETFERGAQVAQYTITLGTTREF